MKIGRDKKGAYIMEAAIVMPIMIFTVITVVLIVMFFYSQMTERSKMHRYIRAEAGFATGTTTYVGSNSGSDIDAEIYTDKKLTGSEVYGKKYLVMKYKGVLDKKGIFVVEGRCTGADAPNYVRYHNIANGRKDEQ